MTRVVYGFCGEMEYELEEGTCDCERVGWNEIVYVEAFKTWGIPMHTKCKRLIMNKNGYKKLNSELS